MSDTGMPSIDAESAAAAQQAAEEESKREAERQGSSGLAEVAEGTVEVLDIAGTVVEGVVSVAGTVVEGVASAIGGLFDL